MTSRPPAGMFGAGASGQVGTENALISAIANSFISDRSREVCSFEAAA